MKMHQVNFEGFVYKMPFLDVEDCEGRPAWFCRELQKVAEGEINGGICANLPCMGPDGFFAKKIIDKAFLDTMDCMDGIGGCWCYLPAFLRDQNPGAVMGREGSLRARRFWIAHQISLLETENANARSSL